jgi:hypothetical protein
MGPAGGAIDLRAGNEPSDYRARSEIESALTQQQKAELKRFLDQFSDSLLRIVAWSENEAQTYSPADDNSMRRVRQIFQ